jgi:hypothetical protein
MVSLDKRRIPPGLEALIAVAEDWGIVDDAMRSRRVGSARAEELERLVAAVDSVDDSLLYGWLAGSESYSAEPTDEYVAITCVTMAADEARVRLGADGAQ